jgi:beta-galactosidase
MKEVSTMGNSSMNCIYLNHNWVFVEGFETSYLNTFPSGEIVSLPHTVKEFPYNNFNEQDYQLISSYKNVFLFVKKRQKRYVLFFEGIMAYCEVYLNKKLVTSHKGGYTSFSVDVTKQIKSGDNELVVMVDSTERHDIPPFGGLVDFLTYGGIYREVYIEEKPDNYIKNALIHVINDELSIRLFLHVNDPKDTIFTFRIFKGNQLVYFFDREYDLNKTDILITEKVYLDLWTLEEPNLYELEILVNGEIAYQSRFANRQVEFQKNGFYLNNEYIKLVGLNRHQSFPYVGYAMPSSAQRKDADILKYDLGVNIVRSSHYPPSKHFLDRCDEIGLLVFSELPGWQYIGDYNWKKVAQENLKSMIVHDYNHPSIVIWGVRINESIDADEFYEENNKIAHSLDPSRPTGGARNFAGSHLFEDVYTYNDFKHRGDNKALETPKKITKKNVPYLVTEYNGHMFPTKKFDDEAHRIEHVKRHLNVQEAAFSNARISGAIGWCMNDYNTHKNFGSGDQICYHGVLDMFRIPKDAAYVYRSIGIKKPFLHVTSLLQHGEYAASELKEVLLLTNVDYVKLYINDDFIGKFYPNVERYPNLPHPPIIIDDFIGNLIFDNEQFHLKDAAILKDAFLQMLKNGMNLSLSKRLKLRYILLKYKLPMNQVTKLYETYVEKKGQEPLMYTFEGFVDDVSVVTKKVGPSDESYIIAKADSLVIQETSTYEVSRVVVKKVDKSGNTRIYANDVIHLKVSGSIQLIGPSQVALIGGSVAVWVKSFGKKGKGTLQITNDKSLDLQIEFVVK